MGLKRYVSTNYHHLIIQTVGPGPWLKMGVDAGLFTLPGGVKPEEFDYFHELIAHVKTIRDFYANSLGRKLSFWLSCIH